MKYCTLSALAAGVLFLGGCHSDALGPTHDVAYFKAHADERKAIIVKCNDDPGTLGVLPNCVNAFEADKQVMFSAPNVLPEPPDFSLTTQSFVPPKTPEKKEKAH